MVIIAAIGAFFKKIWDWIKQTAWIQPLLIVGLIFGVIFSIKPIVDAAKRSSSKSKEAITFYHNYQKSLEGGENSDADKMTYALQHLMTGLGNEEELANIKNKKGERVYKFFLVYAAETCEQCENAKDGFAVLSEKLGTDAFKANDNLPFNMFTIFADQETAETESNKTAFVKYLERHQTFFQECGAVAEDIPYKTNKPLSDTDLEYLATSDPDNFLTPTILLVELDVNGKTNHGYDNQFDAGVTEVMFGVEGESAYDKAQTLLDCWNHEGKFSYNDKK